jgi:hypothetical protein
MADWREKNGDDRKMLTERLRTSRGGQSSLGMGGISSKSGGYFDFSGIKSWCNDVCAGVPENAAFWRLHRYTTVTSVREGGIRAAA